MGEEGDDMPRNNQRSANDDTQMRDKSMNVSMKQRREQKKLQKYDSNSIDEEEFQDYFSNP